MLDLTDKTTFEGNLTIKLNIINHGEEYVFDNNSLIINKPLEGVESYFGKWSLVVKKSDIPEQLKTSNGFLDESKVKNIAILMSYSGNI